MNTILGIGIIVIIGVINLTYALILLRMVFGTSAGAPFVPASSKVVKSMVKEAGICPGDVVFDLGCGDGRMVIGAAKSGAKKSVGIEISLLLSLVAKCRIGLSKYAKNCEIRRGNFFHQNDLAQADVIFAFLFPHIMEEIFQKIWPILKPGARLISYSFQLQGVEPEKSFHAGSFGNIYVYRKS